MIHIWLKPRNQAQGILISRFVSCVHSQRCYSLGPRKPRIRSNNLKKPHKTTQRRRKSIPFVSQVKEIREPDEALSLFHEYHQLGFRHGYPSYSSLAYKLAKCRDFDAVETVLGYVQGFNIRCRETLFVALIQHYGKAHLTEKAVELFHRMTSFDCVRTVQSLNSLLNVLVDNDRLLDAREILDRSYRMGFRPNSVSFNIMMKGLLVKDKFDEACDVFDEMLERKVQPTVVTYNSLIGFLCRKKDVDKAKGLLEDMNKKGTRPNAITYALLMEGLCVIGEHKEAKKIMFDMEYRGCKPRLVNFGVLITDLGKKGKIEEAESLLSEMKKRRFRPDVVIYNILVNYLCKEGKTTEAYKMLTEMQVRGCEPNGATYRMMVDGFCQVGDFEGGLKILNAMLTSRHCPRLETFSCLVAGLLTCGKIDSACFVLEEMEKRNMRFDLEFWGALVRDTCSGDTATDLLTELSSSSGKSNS